MGGGREGGREGGAVADMGGCAVMEVGVAGKCWSPSYLIYIYIYIYYVSNDMVA